MSIPPSQYLETALPLVLGALYALFALRVSAPWALSRLERSPRKSFLASLMLRAASEQSFRMANFLLMLPFCAGLLFLAAWSHSSRAPEALAWLNAHPGLLPVEPTPALLRGLFHVSAFLGANTFVGLCTMPLQRKGDTAQ